MMAKAVSDARRPDGTAGPDAIYRRLFGSFNPDQDGRVSPLEVLNRLERSGLKPDDPRIAEALSGLARADGGSRQISFAQFKALAQHNSSLGRSGRLTAPTGRWRRPAPPPGSRWRTESTCDSGC